MELDHSSLCGLSFNNLGRVIVSDASLGCPFGEPSEFTSSGSIELRTNTLAISGNFVQTPQGSLSLALGGSAACTGFGKVTVSGTSILGGTFLAGLADGCRPAIGQRFDVLTASSISGSFATVTLPPGTHVETRPAAVAVVSN
jgi:hypothetical protein